MRLETLEDLEQLKKKLNDLALEKAKLEGKKEELITRLKEQDIGSIDELKIKIEQEKQEIENLKVRYNKIVSEIEKMLEDKEV